MVDTSREEGIKVVAREMKKEGEPIEKIIKCESRAKCQFSSVIKIRAAAIRPKIWTISPGNDRTLLAL